MTRFRLPACVVVSLVTALLPSAATGQPGAPTNFQVTVSGNTLSLAWAPPTTGGAPTNYRLIARTTTGTVITTQNVWPTQRSWRRSPTGSTS